MKNVVYSSTLTICYRVEIDVEVLFNYNKKKGFTLRCKTVYKGIPLEIVSSDIIFENLNKQPKH